MRGQEAPTRDRQEVAAGRVVLRQDLQRPSWAARKEINDRYSKARGRTVTVTRVDQLDVSPEPKARRLPSLAATTPPAPWTEPERTQRYDTVLPGRAAGIDRAVSNPEQPVSGRDGEGAAVLFTRLPTSPAWSPSAHEEVSVMQHSQRDAWNCLGGRFARAHSSESSQASTTSPLHKNARAFEQGRRRSLEYGCHSGDSPQRERQGRRGSLPDKQQLEQRAPSLRQQLQSPAAAAVRGWPLGSDRPRRLFVPVEPKFFANHAFSRQMRRLV
ncbi:hypothetical protein T484DRAFT_1929188 [Baffinella frigidus]|nr:hypothetical protein T484DRAFT_1929188 [Cryptophyta sp. CCMP2293]